MKEALLPVLPKKRNALVESVQAKSRFADSSVADEQQQDGAVVVLSFVTLGFVSHPVILATGWCCLNRRLVVSHILTVLLLVSGASLTAC
ncbi:hypothetical protein KBZ18_15615 [Synechococcus sp. Cruz-9H2]|uniref:hypothetical protein n=1 Tax=unclassified Synechococcus TaxID=2626047 RepID=UPI0020CD7245|nr:MULTISPECIES: hypothetical protein [unclassified Synechococcus]MCP9820911.1 hypothetical protein [Synechococcus sp. Cruz-9H2]MCP9857311.1 hypothetical protein [Synechococcus sp. Cruz-9C9]MCP9864562.1 hypothetical protein [Synechococcus sp. Cruz-7E5]MCP9871831.1 hypothetical protein [Synechococcus sp. Cruz-7B9]